MSKPQRCVTLAIVLIAALGCSDVEPNKKPSFQDPKQFAEAMDGWAQRELADGQHQEARDWLAQPGHLLHEGDAARAQRLIDGLYDRGAPSVRFTGIQKVGKAYMSAAIAVELPQDPNSRAALLAFEAHTLGRDEPMPDFGQRYLGFSLN